MKLRATTAGIEADVRAALRTLHEHVNEPDGTPAADALVYLDELAEFALRLIRVTNPSKVRDIARTLEIRHRMDAAEAAAKEQR